MSLSSEHRLVVRRAGIGAGTRIVQTLVHAVGEGLAGHLGLDGAAALRPHSHRALVDHAATVDHGRRDRRGHQGGAVLRVIHLT